MSEPQARSTLGTCWRTSRARPPFITACLFALAINSTPVHAQIRGPRAVASRPSTWWVSGGVGASTIGDINDGATRSSWHFGSDPRWTTRASLEKGIDDFTTIGVVAAYGKVDVTVAPLATALPVPTNGAGAATPLPPACAVSCAAQVQLYSLMGQFRTGGGVGFHTLFEVSGGIAGFRNLRTRDSSATPIGKPAGTMDLSGILGPGFGFGLKQGFVIALVQDFGIGFHSKTDLPSGTSRSWRTRTTRASVRLSF